MPIDLATDPDVVFAIRIVDCCFELIAERKGIDPATAGLTREQIIEECWRLLRRGVLRLYDDEVDDDNDPPLQKTLTPAERVHARVIGAKLFAVRRRLRRTARRLEDPLVNPRN